VAVPSCHLTPCTAITPPRSPQGRWSSGAKATISG
jgi:hypothetical protein